MPADPSSRLHSAITGDTERAVEAAWGVDGRVLSSNPLHYIGRQGGMRVREVGDKDEEAALAHWV